MSVQNTDCTCPRVALTGVDLPADLVAAMQRAADERGTTVEGLVEEAFSHIGNRVDPCISTP